MRLRRTAGMESRGGPTHETVTTRRDSSRGARAVKGAPHRSPWDFTTVVTESPASLAQRGPP